MSKNNSCYKDISKKLGWKNQRVPVKNQSEKIDISTQNPPPTKPKTTINPKSSGNGNEI